MTFENRVENVGIEHQLLHWQSTIFALDGLWQLFIKKNHPLIIPGLPP